MKTISIDYLGSIFTEALIEVISKTSGFQFDVLASDSDFDLEEHMALMCLNSTNSGIILISADEHDMRSICSYMLGIEKEEVTKEYIADVLCELVNMTTGNAKLQLADTEYMFTLSTPFSISGADMSITTKKRTSVVSRTLGCSGIKIKMNIIY